MKEQDPKLLQETAVKIKRRGDTLSAITRLRRGVGFESFALSQAVAMGVEAANEVTGTQYLLTYPLYSGLSASTIGLGTYMFRRHREKRKQQTAEKRQEVFRSLTDETIDVMQVSKEYAKKRVLLRWYSHQEAVQDEVSGESLNFSQTASRLTSLVEIADTAGIEEIAMDKSVLGDFALDEEKHGKTIFQDEFMYKSKLINIYDRESDEELVLASLDQCRQIVADLREQSEHNILDHLVGIIIKSAKRTKVPEYYQGWTGEVDDTYDNLKRVLGNELSEQLNDDVEMVRFTTPDGFSRQKLKLYPHVQIQEEKILGSSHFVDFSGNKQSRSMPSRNLLGETGCKTVEELVDKIVSPQKYPGNEGYQNAFNARVALWLLLLSRDDQKKFPDGEKLKREVENLQMPFGGSYQDDSKKKSLFQRVLNEPPQTVPTLQPIGKDMAYEAATVEYNHRSRLRNRVTENALSLTAASLLGIMGGTTLAISAQDYENAARDAIFQKTWRTQPEKDDIKKEEISEVIRMKEGVWQSWFYDGASKVWEKHGLLKKAVIESIVKAGLNPEMIPDFDINDIKWLKSGEYSFSSGLNNSYGSISGGVGDVGDASMKTNKTLFTIEKLSEEPLSPYWYEGIHNQIGRSYTSTLYPFKDMGLSFYPENQNTSIVNVVKDPEDATEPLLAKVSSHYFNGDNSYFALPVPNNTHIVAARIAEAGEEDKKSSVPLLILWDSQRGVYWAGGSIRSPEDLYNPKKIQLQYWIAPSKDTMRAVDSIKVGYNSRPLEEELEFQDIARIKYELGLSPNASGDAVQAAIAQKEYSFTPIADSGVKATKSARDKEDREILTEMGVGLASLDKANCNIAAAQYLLATKGKTKNGFLNYAVGFKEDGDGRLTQKEAHAWTVDNKGNIIDATPGSILESQSEAAEQDELSPLDQVLNEAQKAGKLLLYGAAAGAGGIALYRRRKRIFQKAKKLIWGDVESNYLDDTAAHAAMVHRAITSIEHALYARPGSRFDSAEATEISREQSSTLSERIANLPSMDRKYRAQVAAHPDVVLSPEEKKWQKRLLRDLQRVAPIATSQKMGETN